MIRYSKQALQEQDTYHLLESIQYQERIAYYYQAAEIRHKRYGYWVGKDTSTKNQLKALRMCSWNNTFDDWARLHVTEALLKLK